MLSHLKSDVPCKPEGSSIIDVLRRAASEHPDGLFVDLLDERSNPTELTFKQVLDGAERTARWLRGQGLAAGSKVALLLPTGADFLFSFFGIQIAGAVPVPCPYPLALGDPEPLIAGLSRIVASATPSLIITVPRLEAAAARLVAAVGGKVALPSQVSDPGPGAPFRELGPDDVALLQYSSARVLSPTGAVLTHRGVLANIFGLGTALKLTCRDVALTWVPLVQDMGLVGGLLTSLYWRCPLHVMPPQTFLMHPSQWLKNIDRFKVTLAAAPNAGYQLCVKRVQDRHLAGLDLSRWRLALNGAETVHPSTVEAFRARFAPAGFAPGAFFPSYGLAENTLATACPKADSPWRTESLEGAAPVVSVGGPLAGQELAVVDEARRLVPERTVGEVVVRGPCVMSGYHGDVEATRRAIDSDGWLHTGDLGFVSGGELFLTGRKKDMVIKMGRNYYPSDIEELLASFPELPHTLAFAAPNPVEGTEDLVLLVESPPVDADAKKALSSAVNGKLLAGLGIRVDRLVPVAPGSITAHPRRELQAQYLEGKLG